MKKLYTTLFLILFTLSCSQNFALNNKTIAEYQNDDLKTFITKRFIKISGLNGELSKLNIFLDKILPKQNNNQLSTEEIEKFRKENFIYKAYYSANIQYLLMPRDDLALFCKNNGGELFITEKFSRNFVHSKHLAAIINQIKIGNIVDLNQIREFDYYSGANTAISGYQEALDKGYFGNFSCLKNNDTIWRVGIYPIGFIPKKAMSQTDAHTLILQIIPI